MSDCYSFDAEIEECYTFESSFRFHTEECYTFISHFPGDDDEDEYSEFEPEIDLAPLGFVGIKSVLTQGAFSLLVIGKYKPSPEGELLDVLADIIYSTTTDGGISIGYVYRYMELSTYDIVYDEVLRLDCYDINTALEDFCIECNNKLVYINWSFDEINTVLNWDNNNLPFVMRDMRWDRGDEKETELTYKACPYQQSEQVEYTLNMTNYKTDVYMESDINSRCGGVEYDSGCATIVADRKIIHIRDSFMLVGAIGTPRYIEKENDPIGLCWSHLSTVSKCGVYWYWGDVVPMHEWDDAIRAEGDRSICVNDSFLISTSGSVTSTVNALNLETGELKIFSGNYTDSTLGKEVVITVDNTSFIKQEKINEQQ